MALLSLAMGESTGLSAREIEAGQILVTTDTKKLYVDVSDSSRIELNSKVADEVAKTLAVQVNSAAFKTFKGNADTTINFVAGNNVTLSTSGNNVTITAKDTTYSTRPNPYALTWGNKSYTGSAAAEIKLEDFGLTNVLHFLGTTTTAITDGSTTKTIAIGSTNVTAVAGDIILYSGSEFIWTGSAWEKLGDESLWVPNTRTVSAGTKLSGGGNLGNNVTISHATITTTAPAATDGLFVKNIVTDGYGHITQWTNADCVNLALQIGGTTKTTYDPFSSTAATFNVPIMTAGSASAASGVGLVPQAAAGATTRVLTANATWQSLAAGTGISVSGLTITNAGVRAVTKKSSNVLTVNTNGTSADITVVGVASSSAAGIVKIGSNIGVDANGVISISATNVRNALGAASASNAGYLSTSDYTKFTAAHTAVTWGTF